MNKIFASTTTWIKIYLNLTWWRVLWREKHELVIKWKAINFLDFWNFCMDIIRKCLFSIVSRVITLFLKKQRKTNYIKLRWKHLINFFQCSFTKWRWRKILKCMLKCPIQMNSYLLEELSCIIRVPWKCYIQKTSGSFLFCKIRYSIILVCLLGFSILHCALHHSIFRTIKIRQNKRKIICILLTRACIGFSFIAWLKIK